MGIINAICIILFCVLVVGAILKGALMIYKDIRRHNMAQEKFKVSFKKHFGKVNVPLIKMKINGQLRYFLVDTGSEMSILSSEVFETLPKESYSKVIGQSVSVTGFTGKTDEKPVILTNLSFKNDKYEDVSFIISDISYVFNYIKDNSKIEIAGILGSYFFNKYRWSIDFDERCIWIKPSKNA